ncbi:MAG TPA: S8/S53 family peptidase [Actinomycetota bacterium]|nr:S8/S53 family peptidase [Actinomycetota bacterium]
MPGELGLNVFHEDFLLLKGMKVPPDVPNFTPVPLPREGTFEQRLQQARQGPLGDMEPGTLYYLVGTKLFVYAPEEPWDRDLFAQSLDHGTGVVGSAVGAAHGTNPDGFAVFVFGPYRSTWEWLEKADWIDAISTSYSRFGEFSDNRLRTCVEAPYIRRIVERGRLVFSAAGNAVPPGGEVLSPSGAPAAYQVGGVDDEGRSYLPDPTGDGACCTTTRPYETGDRFDFQSTHPSSVEGSERFGGTSGATPSTAGRATELIQFARSLLGSNWSGVRDGVLAARTGRGQVPASGPLADGDLTNQELIDVLHHTAAPAETASPIRYLVEGYGALSEDTVDLAKAVLAGEQEPPDREQEDVMHGLVESLRTVLFDDLRCG